MLQNIKGWFKRTPKQVKKTVSCSHSKLRKMVFTDENYDIAMSDKDKNFITQIYTCPDCLAGVGLQFNSDTFKNYKR